VTKEMLTLQNITEDLRRIAFLNLSNVDEWRFSYIIPVTLLAVMIGVFLKNIWIGLLIFSVAAYHIVRYVMEYRIYKERKKAIAYVLDRGDISISVEKLSHIATETIYEPHTYKGHSHVTKTVTFFHFMSGGRWRVPSVGKHYTWSKDYHISLKGLENISINGEEFFYISLQGYHDIAYIYPRKFFLLGSDLNDKHDV